jgi:hypothetical protein
MLTEFDMLTNRTSASGDMVGGRTLSASNGKLPLPLVLFLLLVLLVICREKRRGSGRRAIRT